MSGRAASARISQRLRAALERGRPLTYAELAHAAGCTVRSVRNYLADAPATLGVAVRVERGPDRAMRATLADVGAATIDELAHVTARELLRRLFPLDGTSLGRPRRSQRVQVAIAVRGAYEYGEPHLRAMRAWIQAASMRPRRAVSIDYHASEGRALRIVWPLGIVLRDAASVYLAGVPAEAPSSRSVHTYALHRVLDAGVRLTPPDAAGTPPRGIDTASVEDGMDTPFSIFPSNADDAVRVHLVFTPAQARYIEHRRWHRNQSLKRRRDGSLEVRLGPADLHESLAWVRQWGDSVTILGDARLKSAMEGHHP